MRKLFLTGCIGILMFSCSKKENIPVATSSENSSVSEPAKTNLSGDQIIGTLDCSGCHSANEKMIGPSYQEIADKYSDKDVEMLPKL
jgi:cytochrome c